MEIKIAVIVLCAVLKLVGEIWWHNAQRWILPAVLGLGVSLITGIWWLGILVYPCCVPIDLGYTDYGPSNGFDRGAWLAVICAVAGIAAIIFGHLAWYYYLGYIVTGGVWGGVTRNWLNFVIAPISGAIIGCLILCIH